METHWTKRNVNKDFSGYIANPVKKQNIPEGLVRLAAQIKKILLVMYAAVNANRYLQTLLDKSPSCTEPVFQKCVPCYPHAEMCSVVKIRFR